MSQKIAEKVWGELKRKYVDQWQPNEEDIKWLVRTVGEMKVGALWHIPQDGVTFIKIGPNHLRLEAIVTDDLLNALITVERVKKVGELSKIKVDTEKTAEYVQFRM